LGVTSFLFVSECCCGKNGILAKGLRTRGSLRSHSQKLDLSPSYPRDLQEQAEDLVLEMPLA